MSPNRLDDVRDFRRRKPDPFQNRRTMHRVAVQREITVVDRNFFHDIRFRNVEIALCFERRCKCHR